MEDRDNPATQSCVTDRGYCPGYQHAEEREVGEVLFGGGTVILCRIVPVGQIPPCPARTENGQSCCRLEMLWPEHGSNACNVGSAA